MNNDIAANTDEYGTRVRTARQTGRLTFFEISDQQGIQAATDLMLRVVRMTPLLNEADVAKWRKAYEDLNSQDDPGTGDLPRVGNPYPRA